MPGAWHWAIDARTARPWPTDSLRCRHSGETIYAALGQTMHTRKYGFTLIEILAVVTILAITALVTIPYISASHADIKLSAAARAVMSDLLYAQSEAMATQQNVYLTFTVGSGTTPDKYQLQSPLGTALARPAGASSIVTMGTAAATVPDAKLGIAASASPLKIGFDSLGQPFTVSGTTNTTSMTAITIPLQSRTGGYTTTLSIQPFTGEITVQ